jgi:hypothetical protein
MAVTSVGAMLAGGVGPRGSTAAAGTAETASAALIKSGFYAGRDPRTLIEKAIAWWERQIVQIERDAAGR